ncbi:putative conserved membrane protein [Synechococcus sp. PROS-7-1]|nr:putative conserved membrane protein [Synechococcus sp. PROS-7-1]
MDSMNAPTISLLIFGALFAALQIWWIGSLMVRNRRRSGERPLTTSQFRRDLERIFKNKA